MRKITLFLIALFTLLVTPVLAETGKTFSDVSENHIFAETLQEIGGGILRGYGDGTAKLDQRMTREEAILMTARLLYTDEEMKGCDLKEVPFTGYSDWAAQAICMLYKDGIVKGDDQTKELRPKDFVNLSEMDALLVRAAGIKTEDSDAGEPWFAANIRATEHLLHPTLTDFNSDMTRGQFAEMLARYQGEKTNELHTTYQELSQPLGTIESCQEMAGLVKDAWKQSQYLGRPYYYGPMIDVDVMEETMADDAVAAPAANQMSGLGGGGGEKSFSETNIQEAGVDEADIVKTDGTYIYTAQDGIVKIIQAEPADAMKELAQLQFNDFWPQEMYLHQDGDKQYLVLAGGGKGYSIMESDMASTRIWPGFGGETRVQILDVTDPGKPKTLHRFTVEGYLSASRLLVSEGKAYFITNDSFNFWGLSASEVESLKGEDLLPLIKVGDAEAKAALNCDNISYVKGFIQPESVLVTSVDLESGDLESQMILGASAQTIYMSLQNLYLTQPSQSHILYTDFAPERDKSYTRIFKLPLSLDKPALSAQVPGWLLNQFSMSEHEGNFRVATSTGDLWWDRGEEGSGVYVLDSAMKLAGKVENLAPGERIYSARFMGDRGYLVTFRQVDPLFALDLSDPKNPKVTGELKIPGFSNYLHPFGENHLIGIGQDADEDTGRSQGPKVSLFDVSDPDNLKEVDSVVLGSSGYSEAFYNHKAVLFTEDKLSEGEALLAFPVDIWDQVADNADCESLAVDTCSANTACELVAGEKTCSDIEGGGQICTIEEQVCQSKTFHQENFNGAVVFGVSEKGLEEKARITHHTPLDEEKENYVDWTEQIYRTMWIGDNLLTLSRAYIQANALDKMETVVGKLKLSGI